AWRPGAERTVAESHCAGRRGAAADGQPKAGCLGGNALVSSVQSTRALSTSEGSDRSPLACRAGYGGRGLAKENQFFVEASAAGLSDGPARRVDLAGNA